MKSRSASSARRRARSFTLALGINLGVALAELLASAAAHSASLLADAGHDAADAGGLAVALVAERLARRSPTEERSYGYHRATIVSALANVGLLLVVAALVAAEAASRLGHPGHPDGAVIAGVAGGAALANGAGALVLGDRSRNLNRRVAALHLWSDAASSLGVLLVGVVVAATGRLAVLDPAFALLIAGLVAAGALRTGREAVEVLLEASPVDVDLRRLREEITSVEGVAGVHDVHCWSLSSELRALSAHLVVAGHPSLEEAQAVGERVKSRISRPFDIAHTTLELECEPCVGPGAAACSIEEVDAEAARGR